MDEIRDLIKLVTENPVLLPGVTVSLIAFVVALMRRWVVLGWTYEREVKEKEFYRTIAFRTVPAAKDLADVAEKLL